MHVHLTTVPFTPSLENVLADFTEATFTGATALSLGTGAQPIFYDAGTGLLTINLKPPTGGYVWTCTVDPASPETIYGVYLTDTADAVLWGSMPLETPQTISQAGQGIVVPDLKLQFLTTSPF